MSAIEIVSVAAMQEAAGQGTLSTAEILLWDVLPYVTIAVFVVGLVWRYRYDKFGWTTRSSQLYEKKLIRIASPLFHFGILAVLMGHVVGLLIPQTWTDALGVSESMYHFFAVLLGAFAGAATLTGIVLLIYRRRTVGPVFSATTKNDKVMYLFLTAAIILGVIATMSGAGVLGEGHNYREMCRCGSARSSTCSRRLNSRQQLRWPSKSTPWPGWPCSWCGRSRGWCMLSVLRSATSSGRTWSTATVGRTTRATGARPGWEKVGGP